MIALLITAALSIRPNAPTETACLLSNGKALSRTPIFSLFRELPTMTYSIRGRRSRFQRIHNL